MFRRRLGEVFSLVRIGDPNGRVTFRGENIGRLLSPEVSNGSPPKLSSSFSSGSGSNGNRSSNSVSFSAKGPSQQLKSWESGAKLVQNTTVENKYLEHIRDVHDPSQHLKTIEDELKGTIGKALGKQGQKVLMYTKLMNQEREKHEDLLLKRLPTDADHVLEDELHKCAIAHNNYRKECLQARWELIVHRQAVGFIVGNYKFVQEKFPIGDPLPVAETVGTSSGNDKPGQPGNKKDSNPKQFTDQLDWWESIGRWK